MNDYSFIKQFKEIKISKICKKYEINLGNLLSGQTSDENYKKVKNEIVRELLKLVIEDKRDNLILISLFADIIEKQEKDIKALKEMI